MSEFEDNLWSEIEHDHAHDLAQSGRSMAKPTRRVHPRALMGTGIGVAAVGAVLALVLGGTTASPAFAVTRNHDGTVTVRILRRAGIAGANAKLHDLGIRAQVVATQVQASCAPPSAYHPTPQAPPRPQRLITDAHWTIDTHDVPTGKRLVLGWRVSKSDSGNGGNSRAGWVTVTCPNVGLSPAIKRPGGAGNSGNSGNSGNG